MCLATAGQPKIWPKSGPSASNPQNCNKTQHLRLQKWHNNGFLVPLQNKETNEVYYSLDQLKKIEQAQFLFSSDWD